MDQVNFNDENTILVDSTKKYSLYYNTETQIISITDGNKQYGVNIDILGDETFPKNNVKKETSEWVKNRKRNELKLMKTII